MHKIIYLSDNVCIDTTRMDRRTFVCLCSRLEATGIVSPNKNMLVDEQVAITLHILAHHQKQRTIKNNFGRSRETIGRHFRQVINGVITLQNQLLKKPEPVPEDSMDERWKWFKGCLGALDGTHVKVRVPKEDSARYRTHKNEIATKGPGDMVEEIQRQNSNNDTDDNVEGAIDLGLDDFSASLSPLQSPREERMHIQKKRRRSASSEDSLAMMANIKEASSTIGSEIAKASQVFSKVIGADAEISEKRQKIDSEIRKIPGLTIVEVIKLVVHIASRDELIDVFFSMTDEGKEQLVKAILKGDV